MLFTWFYFGISCQHQAEDGECIISYYVTSLFTAVPVASTIDIVKNRLEQDAELPGRTIMSTSNIIELLGFYLNNIYMLFQVQFYEQTKRAPMGSPVSTIETNLYIEEFEHRSITTALNPCRIWKRYVDDNFVNQH